MNRPFRVSWKIPLVELVEGEVIVGVTEAREVLFHRGGHGGCRRHGDVARLGRGVRHGLGVHGNLDLRRRIGGVGVVRRSDGSLRAAADLGELARSVVDEVGEKFLILLARVLAIVLELANGIDDVLLVVVGAVDDALNTV